MKQTFTYLLIALCSMAWAQAPERMNYQAVVRNAQGNLASNNTPVSLRFLIHDVSPTGLTVYDRNNFY